MTPRRRGRRRVEMETADKALAAFGGVRAFVEAQDRNGTPFAEIAERLFRETGVRVSLQTIRNWLHHWQREGEQKEATTA